MLSGARAPARPVEDNDRVRAEGDASSDFAEMLVHGGNIDHRHDDGGTGVTLLKFLASPTGFEPVLPP
jgi:hypothetical protein